MFTFTIILKLSNISVKYKQWQWRSVACWSSGYLQWCQLTSTSVHFSLSHGSMYGSNVKVLKWNVKCPKCGVIWTVCLLCSPQTPHMWPPPGLTRSHSGYLPSVSYHDMKKLSPPNLVLITLFLLKAACMFFHWLSTQGWFVSSFSSNKCRCLWFWFDRVFRPTYENSFWFVRSSLHIHLWFVTTSIVFVFLECKLRADLRLNWARVK